MKKPVFHPANLCHFSILHVNTYFFKNKNRTCNTDTFKISIQPRQFIVFVLAFGLMTLSSIAINGQTITSRQTGNWDQVDTWTAISRTGTISSSTGSAVVTGTGTLFLTELSVGDRILRSDGTTSIGIIASISSNTSLTLTANASNNNSNIAYTARVIPGAVHDVSITGSGHSITIPAGYAAQITNLTMGNASSNAITLALASSASTLEVTGNLTIIGPTAGATRDLQVNAGTLNVDGNLSMGNGQTGGQGNRVTKLTVTSGIVNVKGDLIYSTSSNSGASAAQIQVVMSGGSATFNLSGAFTIAGSAGTGTLTPGSSSTFNFNGTSAQTIPIGVSSIVFNNLYINNTSSHGAALSAAITSSNVTGNIRVQSGTLNNNGFSIAMANSRTFEVSNGAVFITSGTTGLPAGSGLTLLLGNTSQVEYTGSNQAVNQATYGILKVGGSGTKTLQNAVAANNVEISSGSTLDVSASNYNITVEDNWTNNGSFNARNGTVIFNGNTAQTIGGTSSTVFYGLTINNSAGLTLSQSQSLNGTLTFTSGIITTSNANLLTLNAGSAVSGTGPGKYINGPVRKIGNSAFTFPVGKSGVYAPLSISAPANVADAFTAEYIRSSAKLLGPVTAPGLQNVSGCEYWQLERTTGTSNVNITLTWSSVSPCSMATYISNPSSIVVAHFNGSGWDAKGNDGGITGNATAGSVTWNNVSGFSPFTLGSTDAFSNPLPVKFNSIKAYQKNDAVQVEWTTLTEINVDRYEIERASDGQPFLTAGQVTATGNNSTQASYSWLDAALPTETVYYRIKGVDFDGKLTYSSIVRVNLNQAPSDITLYPNPVIDKRVSFQLGRLDKGTYRILITDLAGRSIYRQTLNHPGGILSQSLQLAPSIQAGVYHLIIQGAGTLMTKQFIIH
jgi:hypothetical protein